MSGTYDAIVVGARCAGSPTAMLLARKGYRVLLVDRARFPSDTLSCHFIHQPGVASLKRWGLLPEIARTNCPPVRAQTVDLGPVVLTGSPAPAGDVTDAYAVRRTVLDHILVRAAARAGAEVRERFSVHELVTDGERVTGIRGRSTGGATVTERAGVVIGADGRNSLVARHVRAPAYHAHQSLTCAYYAYWSGIELSGAELYWRRDRATAETYQTTIQFAQLAPPAPELLALLEAVQDNPHETGRFFGTVIGTVSAAEFFAPENIAQITGRRALAG
jgi:flavin-dependent dehydrogenase